MNSMCCETCDKEMYRLAEPSKESPMGGLVDAQDGTLTHPIDVRLANWRWLFCSKKCMQQHLETMDEPQLRSGGFPLW